MNTSTSFLASHIPQEATVTSSQKDDQPQIITPREQEVLHLIAYEHSSKEIASKLFISYETANSHRQNIMAKLGVKNTAGMVRVAFERQLLSFCSVLLVLFASVHFSTLHAQELELSTINFQVRGVEAKWDNASDDNVGGKSEIQFVFRAERDEDGVSTDLEATNSGTKTCLPYSADCESVCNQLWDVELLKAAGSIDYAYDYHLRTWEDDGGGWSATPGSCGTTNRDEESHRVSRRTIMSPASFDVAKAPSEWIAKFSSPGSPSANGSRLDWKHAWRYSQGEKSNPIDFGILGALTTKFHRNSNRDKPLGANDNIGYNNDWPDRGAPDVTYKFTIENEAKVVRLQTNKDLTDFDTYLYLYKGTELLESNDDVVSGNVKSRIQTGLCPGDYTIVVDGFSSTSQGNFELHIQSFDYSLQAGSISSSQSSACEGVGIETITGSLESGLRDNDATYQWLQSSSANGTYTAITGKTSHNLENYGMMGTGDIYFRREVTVCGVTEISIAPVKVSFMASELNQGAIVNNGIDNIRIGYDNYMISSETDASGSPSPITHKWIKKTMAATVWDTIPGATGLSLPGSLGGAITSITNFRRVSQNGCGVIKLADDEIIIEGRPADGFIEGYVRAPGGTGIQGVQVCAAPINGITGTEAVCVLSDGEGKYKITPLYYAKTGITNYKVTPLLAGHRIRNEVGSSDSTKVIELDNVGNHEKLTGGDFVDISVYEVTGTVTQLFQEAGMPNASFGKSKVVIYVQASDSQVKIPKDTTDVDGNYAVIIDYAGDWIITPELVDPETPSNPQEHTFSPASATIDVMANISGVNFLDETTMNISGFVGAGCNKYLGKVDLRFFQDETKDGKFDRTFKTSSDGSFNFTLPAREYKITVGENSITESPQINMQNIYNVGKANDQFKEFEFDASLSHRDTSFRLYYRAPPKLEIEGVPLNPTCVEGTYNFPLIKQGQFYNDFKITVFEGDPSIGCELDTGYIDITDDIGSRGSARLPISKGTVNFLMQGGAPNILAATDYQKTLSMTARDFKNAEGDDYSLIALVTGEKKKKSSFVTVSPGLPLYVLHDPPTDHGYSFLEKNNSTEISIRNYTKKDNNNGGWVTAKVGFDVSQSFGIGAEMGFDIAGWVSGTLDHNISEVNNTTDESIIRITNTERVSTSPSELAIGEDADIFYGAAFNYTYALTDKVAFDLNTCTVDTSTSFFLDPDSIATTYILTGRAIKSTIDDLRSIKMLQHPDSMIYYQNQIDVWEQALEENRAFIAAKAATTPPGGHAGNFTVSGDVVLDRQWVSDIDTFSGFEYLVEIDKGYAIEAGIEIAGNGLSDSYFARVRTETGTSRNTTINKTVTAGYTLSDDDPDDKFTIDIHTDERYGTPLFVLKSALSSCPYEAPQFLGLDQFEFNHAPTSNPSRADILPSVGVAFQVTLSNTGTKSRTYKLTKDDAYNPDAADISIGGNAAGLPGEYTIDPGDTRQVTIIVNKLPAVNVFSYRDLKIDMDPICNVIPDSSRQSLFFSVSFRGDCSHMDVTSPSNGTVVHADDNSNLDIRLQNYDKNKLTKTVLQYRLKGETAYINSAIVDLNADQLEDGASGTQVSWSIPDIYTKTIEGNQIALPLEGEVELRFLVLCDIGGVSNINYSNITTIVVDRKAPVVFGVPSPIDDIYDQAANDELFVAFNEQVCHNGATIATATIKDLVTGDVIPGIVTCSGNTIKIVESGTSLNNRAPSVYRVTLSNVSDQYDNVADPYSWVFIVGAFTPEDLGCIADLEISNNNENQDAINVSTYRALSIISNGAIPNFGTTSYKAQDSITLNMGFTVATGAIFNAQIEDCTDQ